MIYSGYDVNGSMTAFQAARIGSNPITRSNFADMVFNG